MYFYPDKNDRLTYQLISNEYDGEYWEKSEKEILKDVKELIRKTAGEKKMLDLGCGMGRLFEVFEPDMQKIDALEPDKERFSAAEKKAQEFNGKVHVMNGDISSLNWEL